MDKFKRLAGMEDARYPNLEDWNNNFWKRNYLVWVTSQGILFAVNADHEQDAIDYVIDYCEEKYPGLLFTDDEVQELRQESLDDYGDERYIEEYIQGGNHCRYLNTHNVRIEEV